MNTAVGSRDTTGWPSWGPEGCRIYLTDFGPVYFQPGTTEAQIEAIKPRVRRLVHKAWVAGASYPFFWNEKIGDA